MLSLFYSLHAGVSYIRELHIYLLKLTDYRSINKCFFLFLSIKTGVRVYVLQQQQQQQQEKQHLSLVHCSSRLRVGWRFSLSVFKRRFIANWRFTVLTVEASGHERQ